MSTYFTDLSLRAPTIGCMLMCFIAALIGTFVVQQRKSLIGETLSHACYPGVVLSLLLNRVLFDGESDIKPLLMVLGGAFLASLCAIYFIQFLEKTNRVPSDSALTVTLSLFFGIGYLLVSAL